MGNKKHRYAGQRPHELTRQERVARIEQQGISMSDLKANYDLGYRKGKEEGIEWGYDSAYGSMMLALHREFGFGAERLKRLAMATASVQVECITTEEAFRKIVDETGVTLPQMKDVINNGGV